MSDYTIRAITDVPDIFEGHYPGAMRFLTDHSTPSRSRSPTD